MSKKEELKTNLGNLPSHQISKERPLPSKRSAFFEKFYSEYASTNQETITKFTEIKIEDTFYLLSNYKALDGIKSVGRRRGIVIHAKDTTKNCDIVIKKLQISNLSNIELKCICLELWLMKFIDHKNIVKHLNKYSPATSFENLDEFYIVAEFMNYPISAIVANRERYFNDDQGLQHISRLVYQILCGLKCLHDSGIVHGALSTSSIFINKTGDIKIADLGYIELARGELNQMDKYAKISPYRAPEMIFKKPFYSKVDIWACGCILVEFITGKNPFRVEYAHYDGKFSDIEYHNMANIFEILGRPSSEFMASLHPMEKEYIMKTFEEKSPNWDELIQKLNDGFLPKDADLCTMKNAIDMLNAMLVIEPFYRKSVSEVLKLPFVAWEKLDDDIKEAKLSYEEVVDKYVKMVTKKECAKFIFHTHDNSYSDDTMPSTSQQSANVQINQHLDIKKSLDENTILIKTAKPSHDCTNSHDPLQKALEIVSDIKTKIPNDEFITLVNIRPSLTTPKKKTPRKSSLSPGTPKKPLINLETIEKYFNDSNIDRMINLSDNFTQTFSDCLTTNNFEQFHKLFGINVIVDIYERMKSEISNWFCYVFVDHSLLPADENNITLEHFLKSIIYVGKSHYNDHNRRLRNLMNNCFPKEFSTKDDSDTLFANKPKRNELSDLAYLINEIWDKNNGVCFIEIMDEVSDEVALIIEHSVYDIRIHGKNVVDLILVNKVAPLSCDESKFKRQAYLLGLYALLKAYESNCLKFGTKMSKNRADRKNNDTDNRGVPIFSTTCPLCSKLFDGSHATRNFKNHIRKACKSGKSYIDTKVQNRNSIEQCLQNLTDENRSKFIENYSSSLKDLIQISENTTNQNMTCENLNQYISNQSIYKELLTKSTINMYIDNHKIGTTYYYLLLDGRFLDKDEINFVDFVSSIFYVKNQRMHTLSAELLQRNVTENESTTELVQTTIANLPSLIEIDEYFAVDRISKILKENSYINIMKVEKYLSVEASNMYAGSIIRSIGVNNLENFFDYKLSDSLNPDEIELFGTIMLVKAFSQYSKNLYKYTNKDVEYLRSNGITVEFKTPKKDKSGNQSTSTTPREWIVARQTTSSSTAMQL